MDVLSIVIFSLLGVIAGCALGYFVMNNVILKKKKGPKSLKKQRKREKA
jgi:hypothetical protein